MAELALLLPSIAVTFLINLLGFSISAWLQTERYYDFCGSLSFISSSLLSLYFSNDHSPRKLILSIMVVVWASRLMVFLVKRVHSFGDSRFSNVKNNLPYFALFWTVQVIWVITVGFPVFYTVSKPSAAIPLSLSDFFGCFIWIVGFSFQVIADYQKSTWKESHDSKLHFINTGLWKLCRYPNYFGEITLWFGVYFVAINQFPASLAAKYVFALSPLFVTFLLMRVSGVPIQEKQAQKRYATNRDYMNHVKNTSLIVPWFPQKTNKD